MKSIKNLQYKKLMQLWKRYSKNYFIYDLITNHFAKLCVTEKRTYVKTLLIGYVPSLLPVFLAPFLYQLLSVG